MLDNEKYIETNGEPRQSKFDRVFEKNSRVARINCVERLLHKTEKSARQVEQYIDNRPTNCALTFIIQVRLRNVFERRHNQLDVAEHVDCVEPSPVVDAKSVVLVVA